MLLLKSLFAVFFLMAVICFAAIGVFVSLGDFKGLSFTNSILAAGGVTSTFLSLCAGLLFAGVNMIESQRKKKIVSRIIWDSQVDPGHHSGLRRR